MERLDRLDIYKKMTIITWSEFLLKTTDSNQSQTKIYENKILTKGPIFSLQNKSSAIKYREVYSQGLCLLVETKYYFQVWQEIVNQEVMQTNNNQQIASSTAIAAKSSDFLKNKYTPEFLTAAKELLSEYIGPIASIVCQKTLLKNPDLTYQELIDTLAKKIPSSDDSRNFRNTLQQLVKDSN